MMLGSRQAQLFEQAPQAIGAQRRAAPVVAVFLFRCREIIFVRGFQLSCCSIVAPSKDSSLFTLFHGLDLFSKVHRLSRFQPSASILHKTNEAVCQFLDSSGLAPLNGFRRN